MKLKGTTQLNKPLKVLSVRLILLGATLLLLVSSFVYLTVAWYTKMVSVSGMKFQAAKWDFTANFAISDFTINVFEYSTMSEKRAAPGTGGLIPIDLAAWQADTDIEYMITIDRSTMSEEFQKRIFFYYLDAAGNRVYFDGSPDDLEETPQMMEGTIERGKSIRVTIYWEWIYEAPESETNLIAREEWDQFDTEVGKYPALYADYMNCEVSIVGVEVNPEEKRAETAAP